MCDAITTGQVVRDLYTGVAAHGGVTVLFENCDDHDGAVQVHMRPVWGRREGGGYAVASAAEDPFKVEAQLPMAEWSPMAALGVVQMLQQTPTTALWLESNPFAALGLWVHDGNVWVETAEVYDDREVAEALGRARRQLAIYDFEAGAEIALAS